MVLFLYYQLSYLITEYMDPMDVEEVKPLSSVKAVANFLSALTQEKVPQREVRLAFAHARADYDPEQEVALA